jgi:hypothetical protein
MMAKGLTWWVGLDWGTRQHAVCVQDAAGTVVGERTVAHSGEGLAALVAWLQEVTTGALDRVGVVLEAPRGPIVDTLDAAGCQVFVTTPKRVVRMRAQLSEAEAKDDRRDAAVLATLLRVVPQACRRIGAERAEVQVLRARTRLLAELTVTRTQLLLRLRGELARYYPQFLGVAPQLGAPWVPGLWALAPEPAAAGTVSEAAVAAALRAGGARRKRAAQIVAALRGPGFTLAPGVAAAARLHVEALFAQLGVVEAQLRGQRRALAADTRAATTALGIGTAVELLRSVPGVGPQVAAVLVAEAGPLLVARDYRRLRLEGGGAPVTSRSGRFTAVRRRYAHNRRLAIALYHLARVATVSTPHWRARYATLRQRRHSHARALRTIADRLLGVLCAMLRTGTPYEASRLRVAA